MEKAALASTIQLAVTPIFLLTAIAGVLAVLTSRFGRIVDRSRMLVETIDDLNDDQLYEQKILFKRIDLINWSISFCTLSGVLVCILIASLFVANFIEPDLVIFISIIFVVSMMGLISGLFLFLIEVYLAIKTVNVSRLT